MDQRALAVRPGRWLPLAVVVVLAGPLLVAWLPGSGDALIEVSGRRVAGTSVGMPWGSLLASLAVAAAAASLAVCVGGCLAWLLGATDLPGRQVWASVLVVPFVCPGTVWAMAQVYCYGQGGLADRWLGAAWPMWPEVMTQGQYVACALVLAQVFVPVPMLLGLDGVRRLSGGAVSAARLIPSRSRRIAWYSGAIRPELCAAWLLCLALSLGNFAIPHVLQCRLYTIEVYMRQTNYLDPRGAAGLSMLLMAPALAAAAWLAWSERRRKYATSEQLAAGPSLLLGRARPYALAAVTLYAAVVLGLPIGALVVECRSTGHFLAAVRDAVPETQTTLWLAVLAAAVACGLALAVTHGDRRLAPAAATALLAVPPLVLGVAYARFFNRLWPIDRGMVTASAAPLVLALALRGWPFAVRILGAARGRFAPEWRQAAQLAGFSPWQRLRWITGPLLAGPTFSGAVVTYMLAVGEVEITQALAVPGSGTLALRLFTFLHFGPAHVAASLALFLLVLAIVPLAVFCLATGRAFTPVE